ncbi:MAG: DUF3545 family protein [Oceanisphaera sp.]|uniref:DUF3545 family protein n=1 Tax=Oceanisphaera sp. TaxID=1929979 RepID=UPI003C796292
MERSSFSQKFVVKRSPRFNAREAAKIGQWRKIEAILDEQRLQQELQQFDCIEGILAPRSKRAAPS